MSSSEQDRLDEGSAQPVGALVLKDELFVSVMEALPYAAVVVNPSGHIVFISDQTEKIFGYNRNELLGRFVETLVPEHFRERHSGHRANYISHPTTRPMGIGLELTGRRKDGTEFPVEISLSSVNISGQTFVTAIIQDITERRRVETILQKNERRFRDLSIDQERQLILSDRLISFGEMTASLAHEFNNPLGIVIGFAQDLLTEVDPSDPRYQSVKIIEEEALRCKKIMQGLLDFGRQAAPQFTQMDPMEMIRKSVGLVAHRFHKANIRPVIQDRNGLPKIWVDPQQVGQVLVNLFFNAIDAMPYGGTLTIGLAAQTSSTAGHLTNRPVPNDDVIITVADTGQGIEPDHLSKIFLPFFTTKSKKGMGLGLSICKSIMEAHGGKISVESTPRRGTTFYLHLPVERRRSPRDGSVSS